MIATLTFHTDRLAELAPQGFALATDVAEWLVRRGVPFRDAHEIGGRSCAAASQRGIELGELDRRRPAPAIAAAADPGVRDVLSVRGRARRPQRRRRHRARRVAEQLAALRAPAHAD